MRRRAVKRQFRSRNFARAEFVFQPVDLDVARAALLVSRFEIEEGEPTPAAGITLRTRECQCDLRTDRRREPLASIQTKLSVFFLGHCLRETDVRAARQLSHPLARGPKLLRVTRDQMRHGAFDQSLIA